MQKKSGNTHVDSVKKEEIVQAVIIADSYSDDLSPAYHIPCLLPIVNRPLLDYTLQCLSSAHVQEVILFCTANADQLKEFVRGNCWGRMAVNIVVSDGCRSLGDAMRDLDAKALIRGDFILLTGNLVGNLKLLPAIERHKKMQKTDKGIAMTLIYKNCGKKSRTEDDEVFLAINKSTNQLLVHQRASHNNSKINISVLIYKNSLLAKYFNYPAPLSKPAEFQQLLRILRQETLLSHKTLDIRSDLFDTRVSICSISVPPLFSDNFDFQTLDDFVRGLLINEEILASTVYTYVLPPTEYAASVTSWQNYHSISHDIIHRWTYPLVPDMFFDQNYSYKRNNIYIQEKVTLTQSCSLIADVVIGSESVVGENAQVQCSVIGKQCKIGESANINNSHLLKKVTVEKGCKVEFCVIGEGCIIRSGAQLNSCIVGPGVVIGKDKIVENMRIQSELPVGEDGKNSFGPKAFAYQAVNEEGESDSDSDVGPITKKMFGLKLEKQDHESDVSSESGEHSDNESLLEDDTNVFYSEVVDSLIRGYEDLLPCDNLILEINSSRYAYNVTVNEVNYYVIKAILSIEDDYVWEHLASRLKFFMPLMVNYIRNDDAMIDCLHAIEDVAESSNEFFCNSLKLMHLLYNKDIVNEDTFLKWYDEPREDNESSKKIRNKVFPLIKWLKEAEAEDEDEDD